MITCCCTLAGTKACEKCYVRIKGMHVWEIEKIVDTPLEIIPSTTANVNTTDEL